MADSSALVRPGMLETNRELRSGVSIFWPDTIQPEMSAMSLDRSVPAFSSSRVGAEILLMDTTQYARVMPGRKNLLAGVIGVATITHPLWWYADASATRLRSEMQKPRRVPGLLGSDLGCRPGRDPAPGVAAGAAGRSAPSRRAGVVPAP